MNDIKELINGVEYSWSNISFNIKGSPIVGIRGIKYEEEQEKENIYGAGKNPVARGYGRIMSKASVTLLAGTVMNLKKIAPKGQLHLMPPFTIVVAYQPVDNPIQIHHIKNCEFKKTPFEWKEGDTHKEIELELIISHIEDKTNQ